MTPDPNLELDIPCDISITEGYTEAAYDWFAKNQTPGFYLPSADAFYIKAAVRERFPDQFAPSVLALEDMLIEDGMMPARTLKDGQALKPPRILWPPRPRKPGFAPRPALSEASNPPAN